RSESFKVEVVTDPESRTTLLHRAQQALGAATINRRAAVARGERAVDVGPTLLILGHDLQALARDGAQLVKEGHRVPPTPPVDHAPRSSPTSDLSRHRKKRGNADSAGDQQVSLGIDEWEVVAWAAQLEPGSRMHQLVHLLGPT